MAKDTSGIPDVDLTPVKSDLQAQADDKTSDLGQFKTAEDLLASYKEIQGAFTKVSQENKALKDGNGSPEKLAELQAELDTMKEQQELSQFQAPQPDGTGPKSFDESWMENPEKTIDQRIAEGVALAGINEVLADEDAANPGEFQERYAYVNHLSQNPKYAALAKTGAGVKRLFQEADKLREQNLVQSSRKALENVFGEPLDEEHLAKLKKVVFGDKKQTTKQTDAYMPDGSTSTKSAADSDSDQDSNGVIKEAVNKGDMDGVLDEIFKDISA
jgi:hypothetical protein